MSSTKTNLLYDIQSLVIEKGKICDKMRLISAGFDIPASSVKNILEELRGVLNEDGGVPFDMVPGNPSSVKETSEMLPLLLDFKDTHPDLVDKMIDFLVSRQKGDGGFAETLNLDPLIEDKHGGISGRQWYPVGKSVTWLTGKALEALCLVGYDNKERIIRAKDYLVSLQNEDGYWPDFKDQNISDPLTSGNILLGLQAAGLNPDSSVYKDGRAALLQHLKESIKRDSTCDMADLTAVGRPKNDTEQNVIEKGVELIISTQKSDGGWAMMGSKQTDPELSSILGFVFKKCVNMLK